MFNQARKIDDVSIKINQVKTLMGVLIEFHNTMPRKSQDNIIHVAFDLLSEQEKTLIDISTTLSRVRASK